MDVNSDVTPSLHPGVIENLPNYAEMAGYVACAHDAFKTAYTALVSIHTARKSATKDPTLNDAGRILKVASFAEKKLGAITKAFDNANKRLSDGIQYIEDQLTTPLKQSASSTFMNSEIRAHFKALKPAGDDGRRGRLNDALAANDQQTLTAVLGAPAYLSGLTEAERAYYTRRYHEANNPELAKRLAIMHAARALLEERGGLVFREVEKAIGADWGTVRRYKEQKSASDSAFAL